MDVAFNQHSPHARRANRSSTNLNHLSLAPLTSKLPLNDLHQLPSPHELRTPTSYTSYLEGKSAPVTPGILSRNSSHTSLNTPLKKKSKSSTHLLTPRIPKSPSLLATSKSGTATPRRRVNKDDLSITITDGGNSDWFERAGVLITAQAQESRGQSWLTSRASSTSLTGIHNREAEEEEEYERRLTVEREREMHRGHSRTHSGDGFVADDEFSPVTTKMSFGSRFGSRQNSRAGSRRASKAGMTITPMAKENATGYFDGTHEEAIIEPDFVDLDSELELSHSNTNETSPEEDDLLVRRLAKRGNFGVQMFVEKILGFNLLGLEEENGDGDGDEESDVDEEERRERRDIQGRNVGFGEVGLDERVPPAPVDGEVGSWADAAWLLSVASHVLL